ncbi:hypothetical protein EIP86_008479 [Pleurotus ostreatoroseus]|nr:hypothetical protein EIP86_008479 [Pleurotus ostreatoroseus]
MPPVSLPDLASALISALESNTANTVATELPTTFDVLIAEDNPVNQKLAQRFLEKYSHGVEIAENGLLAVEAYKARAEQGRRFDAVLMDVSMPFMGGLEATQIIRQYEQERGLDRVPIIALTAHASEMIT